jgi:hypothetical protein
VSEDATESEMSPEANLAAMLFAEIVGETGLPNEACVVGALHTATMAGVAAVLNIGVDSCLPADESTPGKVKALVLSALDQHWDEFMRDGLGSAKQTLDAKKAGMQ